MICAAGRRHHVALGRLDPSRARPPSSALILALICRAAPVVLIVEFGGIPNDRGSCEVYLPWWHTTSPRISRRASIVIATRQPAANRSRRKITPAFAPARPKRETVRTRVRGRQLFLEHMLEVYEASRNREDR